MKHFYMVLVLLLLMATGCGQQASVVAGACDLSARDVNDGPIALAGEWQMYPQIYLSRQEAVPARVVRVPSVWQNGAHGFASYTLTLSLNPALVSAGAGLYFRDAATSYRIFVREPGGNWRFVAAGGSPGVSAETTRPGFVPAVCRLPLEGGKFELLFEVANFSNDRGGLWNAPLVGRYDDVRLLRERQKLRDFLLIGCLLVIALYNIFLFAVQKQERPALWLGLFCLLFAGRTFLSGLYIQEWYPGNNLFGILYGANFLTMYWSQFLFMLFLCGTFTQTFRRWYAVGAGIIAALLTVPVLVLSPSLFTRSKELFWVYLLLYTGLIVANLYRHWKREREYSALMALGGIVVLALAMLNDILYSQQVVATGFLTPHGFTAFVLIQGYVLAHRQKEARERIQRLNAQIENMQQRFERKLAEQTHELREAVEREQERRRQELTRVTASTEKKVEEVIEYIEQHYRSDIAREGLAAMVDLSPSRLGKAFRLCTGRKIGEYINELRVNSTLSRLLDTEVPVIDIAFEAGFESLSTFNRAFRKCVGSNPTEYREMYAGKK